MTSQIDTSKIDTTFPIPGRDNDSQGFRTNFSSIKQSLTQAASEISDLQSHKASLNEPSVFEDKTQSYSTLTGAVVTWGGVGIGQDVYVGGNVYVNGKIASSGTAIVTTATIAPTFLTSLSDVTFTGTYGQPKFNLSSSVYGNKSFKGTLAVGVTNPNIVTSVSTGISLVYVGTTVTNQTGVYIRGNINDGNTLVLDTDNDTSNDGDFSFIEFRKSPNGAMSSIASISLGNVSNTPSLVASGDWEFTGKVTISGTAILNAPRNVAGVASINGSTGTITLSNLGDFARNLASTGYQRLPGGLIMQWGNIGLNSDPGQVVSFATPFTSCFVVNGSSKGADTYSTIGVVSVGTNTFTVNPYAAGAYNWFAFGV